MNNRTADTTHALLFNTAKYFLTTGNLMSENSALDAMISE